VIIADEKQRDVLEAQRKRKLL